MAGVELAVNGASWADVDLAWLGLGGFFLNFPLLGSAMVAYFTYAPDDEARRRWWEGQPGWVRWALSLVVFYAAANFAMFAATMPGGPVATSDGYFLVNHGVIERVLTRAEYVHALALQARLFSAFALAFACFGAALFRAARLAARRRTGDARQERGSA